jgi:hypothetical protein
MERAFPAQALGKAESGLKPTKKPETNRVIHISPVDNLTYPQKCYSRTRSGVL